MHIAYCARREKRIERERHLAGTPRDTLRLLRMASCVYSARRTPTAERRSSTHGSWGFCTLHVCAKGMILNSGTHTMRIARAAAPNLLLARYKARAVFTARCIENKAFSCVMNTHGGTQNAPYSIYMMCAMVLERVRVAHSWAVASAARKLNCELCDNISYVHDTKIIGSKN